MKGKDMLCTQECNWSDWQSIFRESYFNHIRNVMYTSLYLSAWAAITKYHRLGGLNNSSYFLTVWRLEVWDQRFSMVRFWWEFCSWFADGRLLTMSTHGTERALVSLPLLIRAPALWIRVPPLSHEWEVLILYWMFYMKVLLMIKTWYDALFIPISFFFCSNRYLI